MGRSTEGPFNMFPEMGIFPFGFQDTLAPGGLVPRILLYDTHVPMHRLWAFATLKTEPTLPEHNHMLHCQECCFALLSCMNAENFEAATIEIQKDDNDSIAEAS